MSHFHEFYLQKLLSVFIMKIQEGCLGIPGRRKTTVNIETVATLLSIMHADSVGDVGFILPEKSLFLTPLPPSLLSHPSRGFGERDQKHL